MLKNLSTEEREALINSVGQDRGLLSNLNQQLQNEINNNPV